MTCNTVLRLGLIGTGQMAAHYAHSWVAMPEVAFVAVSDIDPDFTTEIQSIFVVVRGDPSRENSTISGRCSPPAGTG